MTRAGLLVALCGCDGALGLHATTTADAFVADTKLPPACPALGTAPSFVGQISALPARVCRTYSLSTTAGRAIAACGAPNAIYEGPIDSALEAVAVDFPPDVTGGFPFVAKLAPEGDVMVVATQIDPTGNFALDTFQRAADGWHRATRYLPGSGLGIAVTISTPSRGPDRRLLYASTNDFPASIVELVDAGLGEWSVAATAPVSVPVIATLYLSGDGRRALVVTTELLYMDRPDQQSSFGPLQPVVALPDTGALGGPFMTPDCGRLYFDAIDTILYVEER